MAAHPDHEQVRAQRYRSHDSRGVLPDDTVMGSDMRHCVLTLVERKTGYAIIKKPAARNKDEVTRAATHALPAPLPQAQNAHAGQPH